MCGNSADRQSMCSFLGQLFRKVISGKGPKNLCAAEEKDFKHWLLLLLWSWNSENNTSQEPPRGQRSTRPFKNFNFPVKYVMVGYLLHALPDHSLPFCPELHNPNQDTLGSPPTSPCPGLQKVLCSRDPQQEIRGGKWMTLSLPQMKVAAPLSVACFAEPLRLLGSAHSFLASSD